MKTEIDLLYNPLYLLTGHQNVQVIQLDLAKNIRKFATEIQEKFSKMSFQIFSIHLKNYYVLRTEIRGVFRTFELRVLIVIDCPKTAGAKGR